MRKALALLGLVALTFGLGTSALARSGSDSSGQHSYSLTCDGGVPVFFNTGSGNLRVNNGPPIAPGSATELTSSGWSIAFEDPEGSGNWVTFDSGSEGPEDVCEPTEPDTEPSWTVVCGDEAGEITFTNTASAGFINIVLTVGVGYFLAPGESLTSHPNGPFPPAGSRFEMWFINDDDGFRTELARGDYSACTGSTPTTEPNNPAPEKAPDLLNECRGDDWYLVNPDVDDEDYTFAYRIGEPIGKVLYDPDYTSNNPDAVYGEVLVPAGTNEVGYVDDFNVVHTATRPTECGGPTGTTAPPTTQPSTPTEPTSPNTAALGAATGDGFVAAGAQVGPGMATFGATGFAPGEQVEVVLHSTPRPLGTVTANADGLASITFELLASDGAGEHSVVFTGPSGTVTIPFTLVLPAQALPQTR